MRPWLRRLHGTKPMATVLSHLQPALTSALAGPPPRRTVPIIRSREVYFILANMIAGPLTALWSCLPD